MNDDVLRTSLLRLYEQAPCGYMFTLMDGTIVRVNQTLISWLDYTHEELVGTMKVQDLLSLPGKLFYENQYDPLLRMQGLVNEVTFDFVRKDQQRLPVLMNSVLQKDDDGQPILVASSVFNATQRRSYERELLLERRRAEQIAAIVTNSSDAILTVTPDSIIETWNAGAERVLGTSASEAIGCHLRDFLVASGELTLERLMGRLRSGETVHWETQTRRPHRSPVDVSVAATPYLGLDGELISVSLIARDITERRSLERLQQEFLAVASHELKNPVTAIKAHAQLMLRRGSFSESSVTSIVSQANQLRRLIDDLLVASQVQADRLDLHLTPIDVVAELREAAASLGSVRSTIHLDVPNEPIVIRADRSRLTQVLANLLTNAIKYSPAESTVLLKARRTESEVELSVIDEGVGIPSVAIPHLFERFFRAEGAAGHAEGLGLGLYISRTIVEGHGGTIKVKSEPGQGSEFTIHLPLADFASSVATHPAE